MSQEKTKEPEKVEENEKSMKFVVSPSTLKKLQAALAGKTGTMTPTMPAVPTMPMMPMMLVIQVIPCFPMYPLQMYQTAPSPQELPDEIEIDCIDAEGKVVKVKMVKDSSITQK